MCCILSSTVREARWQLCSISLPGNSRPSEALSQIRNAKHRNLTEFGCFYPDLTALTLVLHPLMLKYLLTQHFQVLLWAKPCSSHSCTHTFACSRTCCIQRGVNPELQSHNFSTDYSGCWRCPDHTAKRDWEKNLDTERAVLYSQQTRNCFQI